MLGREEVAAAVEVRTEADTFVRDLAQGAEREDLKSAGVGKHGTRPTDESVQAAETADGLVAGAEIEVISVAEDDLRTERFERVLGNSFDSACGADGHEDGSLDGAVG